LPLHGVVRGALGLMAIAMSSCTRNSRGVSIASLRDGDSRTLVGLVAGLSLHGVVRGALGIKRRQ
jgi:hypothetical protein